MTASVQPVAVQYPIEAEDLGRAGFYGVLSRLFASPPDQKFLAALRGESEIDPSLGEVARCWNDLVRFDAAESSVREEYEALFLGVGRPRVMVYGSFFLAGFMMEKPLAALRDDLAELGLARVGGTSEPEDHFASLMEVMRHLILEQGLAAGERAERQQVFFGRHIEPWYARFADALEGAEGAVFYRQAARFARAFLDVEKESFSIAV